ncbi:MAG: translational GTPase TypA [Thiohalospira sp.]|uniref:translational GTPase TypA n=1 Tax=Thiohalospira sp. TaxID=3080549 RepID=UPI00397F0496
MIDKLRNIAIVAHVDHGKTTLVDQLLRQSNTLERRDQDSDRILDSNDQERERGITILSKNTGLEWGEYRINIVDTPGHADFGGEVERVMSMVDSVLLLVDAVDGPMPQTRFVTEKAFAWGLKPIVVVNKVDRDGADPERAVEKVFDLFDALGASDEQLDFPVIYASALSGIAGTEAEALTDSMEPLFQAIVDNVPAPDVDADQPLQMQISALDYSTYQGVIGIGRITRGQASPGQQVTVVDRDGNTRRGKLGKVMTHMGLARVETDAAMAGDIIGVTGIDGLFISDTLCDPSQPEARPPLTVDEPTVSMTFQVNDSPFAGREGKYVTSRNIKERLEKELIHNVAMRVEQGEEAEKFKVSGRGELHLSVLIESMRREGFELGVSRPEVIVREGENGPEEPYEDLMVDVEEQHQGAVMEELGQRKGDMKNMEPDGHGRVRMDYIIPSRGLIGFRGQFLTLTSGSGILNSRFDHYGPLKEEAGSSRHHGVLVSMATGKALAYSLFTLQDRGRLFIEPGVEVYEGMIIGANSRPDDMTVNPTKAKKLDNMRSAGTDEALDLVPPVRMTLEQALEFIADDELVEVTPENIRLRKKLLTENERKRQRNAKAA